jgi:hypothetical protein
MSEIRVLRSGTPLRPCGVRTAAWMFACCLLIHGTGGPGYAQTDTTLQRGSRGSTFRARVVGTTNTQAVLAWSAPDSDPCTVEVSESATYSPLVHDVDPTLFTGANSDARTSGITSGTSRIVVLGARLSQTALDSNIYSRALQAATAHYYRITCGSSVATGTFTTANIPLDMRYQDAPQQDPTNPGNVVMPTISTTDRTQVIIDPKTGALIRHVSLPADTGWPGSAGASGPYLFDGGFIPLCGENLITTPGGDHGYLCSYASGDGGYDALYFIVPSTGEARYLGWLPWAYAYINPTDSQFYTGYYGHLSKVTYTGDYTAKTPNTGASYSVTTIIADPNAAIQAFDPTFNPAYFGGISRSQAGGIKAIGDYVVLTSTRGSQGSYGWVSVFRISTASVVAATPTFMNIRCRWCDVHSANSMYTYPLVYIGTHELNGNQLGQGPYKTAYSGGGTLDASTTTFSVSGEPSCSGCGADPAVPLAQAGDRFYWNDTYEYVIITAKNSPTSWTVTRGASGSTATSHAPGATLQAACNYLPVVWNFLADPHGTDTTNTNFVSETVIPIGGHDDWDTNLWMTEHWPIRVGDVFSNLNQPITRTIPSEPHFAGKLAQCFGDACVSHPSVAHGQTWFTDYFKWDSPGQNDVWTQVSGQLYKLTGSDFALFPRHFAPVAVTGASWVTRPYNLYDVSGPDVTLATDSSDNYKLCIANVANECHHPSSAGDVFINLPGTPATTCGGQGTCIGNYEAYGNSVLQMGLTGQGRVISGGLAATRAVNAYPTAKVVGSNWLQFTVGGPLYAQPSIVMMAKLPPFTAGDSVDRTTFIRAPLSITPPQGQGIATATVEFGYLEQGTPSQHYCTSRREACVAVASAVTDATPFWYVSTDTYTRASCATSCTITLPVLPAHVAYYQVRFYDAHGTPVGLGDRGLSVEAAAVKAGGIPANAIQ